MTKQEQRREARARLERLSPAQRQLASEEIARRLWSVTDVARARVMLLYASIGAEVETDAIAAEAVRRGIVLTYPRCLPAKRGLVIHRVNGHEELRGSGAFGIREPDPGCPVLDPGDVDVALVPGLAWDRKGTRLGRGEGYYDRLFAHPAWRGSRVGLFFATQEFEALASDAHDACLDAVVTEREVVRP